MRATGADHYITLQRFQQHSQYWMQLVEHNYGKAIVIYIGMTMACVLIGIPAVMPLSLLAGLLFGMYAGIVYTMLGIIIASLLAFLIFRYFLKNYFYRRYAKTLDEMRVRIKKMGISYFLMLYFSSVVPTLFINILAALSGISITRFIGMTIIGCLPVVTIFAMAGNRFTTIHSVYDIFSPGIIMLFLCLFGLACFPWVMRRYGRRTAQHHE
jgi:uncharacterized membrane protein YdjX (TVP38/TMEM64 family)